jgi:FkbM family methyltransferase
MPLAHQPFTPADLAKDLRLGLIHLPLTAFDQYNYLQLIEARAETIARVVTMLKSVRALSTALDVGCGVGFFSETLRDCGLAVRGFDARRENVFEAVRRFPGIQFHQTDLEDPTVLSLGKFDLTLCFGLLYHLENPMLAVRHLHALTGKALLLESMCIPDGRTALLLREEPRVKDQSLTDIALYPSEICLVKMLYRAGFAAVYRLRDLPDHEDFQQTLQHARRRTVLLATVDGIPASRETFELLTEPRASRDPWSKRPLAPLPSFGPRIWRFLQRPRREQYISLVQRARRRFPALPLLWRTSSGSWWLARDSALDERLIHASFEERETLFMQRVLRPGMTVVDAGAHHGFYTLLASRLVGRTGRVVAFEPSPRERKRWRAHVRINLCRNAEIHACALGDDDHEQNLCVVQGREDWCNSLREPHVGGQYIPVRVQVKRLDEVLGELQVPELHVLKLDVEGAELSVLRGARETLLSSRPVILAEVQDLRTRAWGYHAQDLIDFLTERGYSWFAITSCGALRLASTRRSFYSANLVALPAEHIQEFRALIAQDH